MSYLVNFGSVPVTITNNDPRASRAPKPPIAVKDIKPTITTPKGRTMWNFSGLANCKVNRNLHS